MSALLPSGWDVPQEIEDRLGEGTGRQRAMVADGHLLLILHAPSTSEDLQRTGRVFWRRPDGSWESAPALGEGIGALAAHLEEYRERVAAIEDEEGEATTADDFFGILRAVTPVRRAARNMLGALQVARESIRDRDLISMRDRAGDIARATELLQSDAKNGLDYAMAKQAEVQTLSAHRLNLLAALFFPLATFAGVFGMNLAHGLETSWAPWLFWVVVALGVSVGFLVKRAIARPLKL